MTDGRRLFLPKNKTFEGICLAIMGKFLQKELWIYLYLKPFCKKKTIKFSFKPIYEQLNLAARTYVAFANKKHFFTALPVLQLISLLYVYVVVQFCPWFNFYFPLF